MLKPVENSGYRLLHEGTLTLAEIERNGIRINRKYLKKVMWKIRRTIAEETEKLKKDEIGVLWKKIYGNKTKFGSRHQLSYILFEKIKIPNPNRTERGRFKADEDVLEGIDIPFVKRYIRIEKLKKILNTYLSGIWREVDGEYVHPTFNLGNAATFRSTSNSPNFQNIPIRVPWIAKIIRSCFIPRPGRQLVEVDYGRIEVCGSTCYHKDPNMIRYLTDPTKDMHRDMAMKCFMLKKEEVDKTIRYCGKNMFVFPQFYGDFYIDCAKNLWNAIGRLKLCRPDGVSLYDHLREKGITSLGACEVGVEPKDGTFEKHIRRVEYDFWNNTFPTYMQWKKKWWNNYLRTGGFYLLTGFYIEGVYRRNEVINYPIQGTSFHFLLWSLIQIIREIKKRKMKTLIVGQIHDSIVADVPPDELSDYLGLAQEVMTEKIRKHWPWIIVPLEIEAEVCDIDRPWSEKRKYEGTF